MKPRQPLLRHKFGMTVLARPGQDGISTTTRIITDRRDSQSGFVPFDIGFAVPDILLMAADTPRTLVHAQSSPQRSNADDTSICVHICPIAGDLG